MAGHSLTDDDKWIAIGKSIRGVGNAARVTLETRLSMVVRLLPLAASRPEETPEHVHQLRVSTRRALAALKLYDEVLPEKHSKWIRKQMKRIRKAAGEARDLDVLMERHAELKGPDHGMLISQLKKQRRHAQKPLVKLHGHLTEGSRLAKRVAKLLQSIPGETKVDLSKWARRQMRHEVQQFWERVPRDTDDTRQLHRFRVQAKELRYTIELLASVFPERLRTRIYPIICRTQDSLGEVNDHVVAGRRLVALSRNQGRKQKSKRFQKMSRQEAISIESSKARFHRWWTPSFADALDAELRRTLS